PLYKHWPYVIVRDRSGVAYGLFYDTLSSATFDLGCEHDNYHGLYRYCEIEAGDLDYYIFVGPKIRDVVAKFAELTGRMAFGPPWSRNSGAQGFASSRISSRAFSTIIRTTSMPHCVGRLSATRQPASRASVNSGTVRARTSTSRIPRACAGGRRVSDASFSPTAFWAGTTTTNTRSGTTTPPRTASGRRYRLTARVRCSRC